MSIILDDPLSWQAAAAVAGGAGMTLSEAAWQRLAHSRAIVEAIVAKGILAYGVNTGAAPCATSSSIGRSSSACRAVSS